MQKSNTVDEKVIVFYFLSQLDSKDSHIYPNDYVNLIRWLIKCAQLFQ